MDTLYWHFFKKIYGSDYKNDKSSGVLSEVFPLIFLLLYLHDLLFVMKKNILMVCMGLQFQKLRFKNVQFEKVIL
jgi:hypothetical protein